MVIEIIPFCSFKEKIKIIKEELKKNRYIEIWDKYIYTETKYEDIKEMG